MGGAMARNLKGAGMEVRAWNRSRERAEPLAEDGIVVAQSAAEAARGADFLVTMLADGGAVAEVVGGEEGTLAALAENGVWIETSTVGLGDTERLARVPPNTASSTSTRPYSGPGSRRRPGSSSSWPRGRMGRGRGASPSSRS
jgi:hypothetical protein